MQGISGDGAARGDAPRVVLVLGDQLDHHSPLLTSLGSADIVLMLEVAEESRHVPSHIQRTLLFLSAMRHFAQELRARGRTVRYVALDDPLNTGRFESEILRALQELRPRQLVCLEPGEWRVLDQIENAAKVAGIPVEIVPDPHFITTPEEFASWARGRTTLTMEYFYRDQRRKTGYLMEHGAGGLQLMGGQWNFDKSNRLPFGKSGPNPSPKPPIRFAPDAITLEAVKAIRQVLPELPGSVEDFGWAVCREQALMALDDFIENRLENFGPYEDAMWRGEPTLYHSTLSSSLNLKLLNPRECCERAVRAYEEGKAPLQSVEGFIRQVIGWREFIRGIYWLEGREYAERNSLDQHGNLPSFYWTGKTDMACLASCLGEVLKSGYGHHIQRLMVTGNFALTSGVHPKLVSDWYLGMFVDGVDWVTLPNTLGMVMHADQRPGSPAGVTGLVGTKPYAASGKYIERMSNYCSACRYRPSERTGPDACPVTVFYWDFLLRNQTRFAKNQRMQMMLKNLERLTDAERQAIRKRADDYRDEMGITGQSPT